MKRGHKVAERKKKVTPTVTEPKGKTPGQGITSHGDAHSVGIGGETLREDEIFFPSH